MKTKKMLFTPRTPEGKRLRFWVKEQPIKCRGKWNQQVEINGKKYLCRGASCGLDCHCDAIIYGYEKA